ncbi:MAG: tRNA guanosine(34) transglycosylase Tgt [Deltaproteobacteria bacterium]|jgi:queuine tRNA-ribosyltransferase|nr:tRNA guanosine(34) transglycosylase Tgt [Deltaproteobacteria bacterium]
MWSDYFQIEKTDPQRAARAGVLLTPRGVIATPTFMAVGTRGSVKAMSPEDLTRVGAQIILANAFHLILRPGLELIRSFGGLGAFMGWPGPILTDSGGYQVFSLADARTLSEEGVTFRSPYDGQKLFLSPEIAIKAQMDLGVDILMCLDECAPYPATEEATAKSLALTMNWAERGQKVWLVERERAFFRSAMAGRGFSGQDKFGQALFGIVQGGFYPHLRAQAAEAIAELEFPGHAIGGLALGEPMEERLRAIETARERLPASKPLYLMGLGTPEDLVEGIQRGADLFDCVLPTRNARNGQFFTRFGRLNINNSRHKTDQDPVDPQCSCPTCQVFSRAYLRHLFQNHEPLFPRLATIHNLSYYLGLAQAARAAIMAEKWPEFVREFYSLRSPKDD